MIRKMSSPLARLFALLAAATLVLTGIVTLSGARPAAAAEAAPTYTVGSYTNADFVGTVTAQSGKAAGVVLMPVVDASGKIVAFTYCVQMNVGTKPGVGGYTEKPWAESGIQNLPKVQWILNHSVPKLTTAELSKAVGTNLTSEEAVLGTQAAIWHFTDNLVWKKATVKKGDPTNAKKVYNYLVRGALKAKDAEPATAITFDSKTADGKTTYTVTVKTSDGSDAALKLEGDEGIFLYTDGTEVDLAHVKSGKAMNFIPSTAVGKATLTATGSFIVPSGRVFFHEGNQVLIAAKSENPSKVATIDIAWKLSGGAVTPTGTPVPSETAVPTVTSDLPTGTHSQPGVPTDGPSATHPTTGAPTTAGAGNPGSTVSVTAGTGDNGGTDGSVPPPMAQTGANVLMGVLAAVALLAAGGVFVLVSRKKSATR